MFFGGDGSWAVAFPGRRPLARAEFVGGGGDVSVSHVEVFFLFLVMSSLI